MITQQFLVWGVGIAHVSSSYSHVYDQYHAAVVNIRQCTAIIRDQAERCEETSAMERRAQVQSCANQTNWQANWTLMQLLRSCRTTLSFEEQLNWRKLLTWTDCLSRFQESQSQTRFCKKVTSGRAINYPLYDAMHEKSRLYKRATHASAQSSAKAKFIYNYSLVVMLHYARTRNANQCTKILQLRHSCRNINQT